MRTKLLKVPNNCSNHGLGKSLPQIQKQYKYKYKYSQKGDVEGGGRLPMIGSIMVWAKVCLGQYHECNDGQSEFSAKLGNYLLLCVFVFIFVQQLHFYRNCICISIVNIFLFSIIFVLLSYLHCILLIAIQFASSGNKQECNTGQSEFTILSSFDKAFVQLLLFLSCLQCYNTQLSRVSSD